MNDSISALPVQLDTCSDPSGHSPPPPHPPPPPPNPHTHTLLVKERERENLTCHQPPSWWKLKQGIKQGDPEVCQNHTVKPIRREVYWHRGLRHFFFGLCGVVNKPPAVRSVKSSPAPLIFLKRGRHMSWKLFIDYLLPSRLEVFHSNA